MGMCFVAAGCVCVCVCVCVVLVVRDIGKRAENMKALTIAERYLNSHKALPASAPDSLQRAFDKLENPDP